MGEVLLYTLKEVADHNTHKDCWPIIDGNVYDMTKYLEGHPEGDGVLLVATGMNATDYFEDVGHSTTSIAMLDEFYVRDIDKATISSKVGYKPPNLQADYNQDKNA